MATGFIGFLLLLFKLISSEYVPVLIVGSDSKYVPEKPNFPFHKLNSEDFRMEFVDKMVGKGPLIVFIQDTLSLEDFDTYGKAYTLDDEKNTSFSNLNNFLDEKPFLLLSAVDKPENGLNKIEENWLIVKMKDVNSPLSSLNVDLTPKTLIFVELPITENANNRFDNLKRNDEIIGKIVKDMQSMTKEFVFLFTARFSSWNVDQNERIRISRHILEADPTMDGVVLYNTTDNSTKMYLRNATFSISQMKNETVDIEIQLQLTDFTVDTTHDNGTSTFTLSIKPGDPILTELVLQFEFVVSGTNWVLNELTSSVTGKDINGDFEMKTNDIWAPKSFSFNCKQPSDFVNANQSEYAFALKFEYLQVEPFMDDDGFGYSFDCVGFFTIPILSALFAVLILLLTLMCGLQQMFSIHTMDRFDDPKGKTITVNTVD